MNWPLNQEIGADDITLAHAHALSANEADAALLSCSLQPARWQERWQDVGSRYGQILIWLENWKIGSAKPRHHFHWYPPQPWNTPALIPISLSFQFSLAVMPKQLFLGGVTSLSGANLQPRACQGSGCQSCCGSSLSFGFRCLTCRMFDGLAVDKYWWS